MARWGDFLMQRSDSVHLHFGRCMQVFACMKPNRSLSTVRTRERMLAAAARVFARDGIAGATTRAIADEAKVNEVTLFRHFESKDGLVAAVVGDHFGGTAGGPVGVTPAVTNDLREDLLALASHYAGLLTQNLPLVRTMIGETHHTDNSSYEKQVFRAVFLPAKEAVLHRIETAQKAGDLQRTRKADVLADLFCAMIFTGVLRRSAPQIKINYSATAYLESVVELFLNGALKDPRSK